MNQNLLKSMLEYSPESGLFIWIKNKGRGENGSIAGYKEAKGYIQIKINQVGYKAHRLAWLYMTGDFPILQIDHINRIKDDNRWENLRLATPSENQRNKIMPSGISGFRGVVQHCNKWRAQIKDGYGRQKIIGLFDDKKDAAIAYDKEAKILHGDFAVLNFKHCESSVNS